MYEKGNKQQVLKRISEVEEEIEALKTFDVVVGERSFKVEFQVHLTMVDGKTVANLTDSSTQSCYVCGCTPKQMNDIASVSRRPIIEENLAYGLTTMHLWIRFLELVLHLAYMLPFKQWSTRGLTAQQKIELATRKKEVQQKLYEKFGVRVDKVVQGKGSSNTGNIGRKLYASFQETAEITGVDQELICRFGVILSVLSSGKNVIPDKFDEYARQTAEIYVKYYRWYYMPPAVHKVLIHGAKVIERFVLPIGMMSEEALETSNKVYRRVRERHTRKTSRIHTITDLANLMLALSDPKTSLARVVKVRKGSLCQRTLKDYLRIKAKKNQRRKKIKEDGNL